MSLRIYCISGLGADEQMFSKLQLPNTELCFLKWIDPLLGESFSSYTARMLDFIPEPDPIILGVSFGGMLGVEISKQKKLRKLILISSIKTKDERPWWMKTVGSLHLHRVVKPRPHPILYSIENYYLGVHTDDEKKLAVHFRENVQRQYLQWAISKVLGWQNVTIPENCIQIHGTADRIFPVSKQHPDYMINGGGHFITFNRAEEISRIISRELQS